MKIEQIISLIVFFLFLTVLSYPFSRYILKFVYPRQRPLYKRFEDSLIDFFGLPKQSMGWRDYLLAIFQFHIIGFIFLFILLFFFSKMTWSVALNTTCSFITNTNWQTYAGEEVLSPLIQMIGLSTQNFLSAAVGICILMSFARGFLTYENSSEEANLGNFWVDLIRSTLLILLPISFIFALMLISQGVVQTFSSGIQITTLENLVQKIPLGPVASQVAIKMLGTNGGGYFGVNGAHPFENPNGFSNMLQLFSILFIPASLVWCYGEWVKKPIHGRYLFFSMLIVVFIFSVLAIIFENHSLMEGKEWRFGKVSSALWDVFTTVTSNGSLNSSITSSHPLTIFLMLFSIMCGGVFFGGIGVGMVGFLLYLILTIFLCGLMVGKGPEYMGKKIEAKEMQLTLLSLVGPGILVLAATGIVVTIGSFVAILPNRGPHLFSEILYAMASTTGNNGSAMNGFPGNVPWMNVLTSFLMLAGRALVLVPPVIMAQSFSEKRMSATTIGSLDVNTPIFMTLNLVIIFIVGALNFFPALLIGPILEHLLLLQKVTF